MGNGKLGAEVNEKKILLIAQAKRELADLTDFEINVKCISTLSPNEFTDAKLTIQIRE